MKKLLICGANGFIGKNLIEHFVEKYDIRAVDIELPTKLREGVEWMQLDLRNQDDVKKAVSGVDIILHYAATTTGAADIVSKPYIHVTDNVVMTSLLIREAHEQNIKHFVMPSCTIMYNSSEIPVKEEDYQEDAIPPQYYGAGHTKVYLEKMCHFFSTFKKTKYSVLRQSNIYGPNDKFDLKKGHVFAASIIKVSESNDVVNVWGTGEEERDLLYIDDLLTCIEKVIEKQNDYYCLINVGTGKSISISKLVEKIISLSGKKLTIQYDETKPTIKTKLAVDITKAAQLFDWKPNISIEEGINKTFTWYDKNIKRNK
jgi:nucleoside-diphosphate-sugar epimerase